MAKKELIQNPQRYSKTADNWVISASPSVQPLLLPIGVEIGNLKPLLVAGGIIVRVKTVDPVSDVYLISPQTLQDIKDSNHPHYTSADNGKVLGAQMGKTIPIVSIDVTRLADIAGAQDEGNRKAGVKEAEYIFEGDTVDGLPVGLIKQINWTLFNGFPKPSDTFQVWDLDLKADYSIEALVIETSQLGGKIDTEKLQKLIEGVNERLKGLRSDFNMIVDVYENGKQPAATGYSEITKVALPPTETGTTEDDVRTQVVIKYSELGEILPTPLTTGG